MRQVLREGWALSRSAELPARGASRVPFTRQNDILHRSCQTRPRQTFWRLLKERCWVGPGEGHFCFQPGLKYILRATKNPHTDLTASAAPSPLPTGAGAQMATGIALSPPNSGKGWPHTGEECVVTCTVCSNSCSSDFLFLGNSS